MTSDDLLKHSIIIIGPGATLRHLPIELWLGAIALNHEHMEMERLRLRLDELPPLQWPKITIVTGDTLPLRNGLQDALRELSMFETVPPSSALSELVQPIDIKLYPKGESGLACQAPGYGSPRLRAKALRKEAMKVRGSKGR